MPEIGRAHSVMDDEPEIRDLLIPMLGILGYEGETVADGAEAFRQYVAARTNGKPFAAVILDLTVPGGMGGKETMEKLRAVDPGVTAIVSSGYSEDPVMANYRDHGFKGVIPKPYRIEALVRTLHNVIAAQNQA